MSAVRFWFTTSPAAKTARAAAARTAQERSAGAHQDSQRDDGRERQSDREVADVAGVGARLLARAEGLELERAVEPARLEHRDDRVEGGRRRGKRPSGPRAPSGTRARRRAAGAAKESRSSAACRARSARRGEARAASTGERRARPPPSTRAARQSSGASRTRGRARAWTAAARERAGTRRRGRVPRRATSRLGESKAAAAAGVDGERRAGEDHAQDGGGDDRDGIPGRRARVAARPPLLLLRPRRPGCYDVMLAPRVTSETPAPPHARLVSLPLWVYRHRLPILGGLRRPAPRAACSSSGTSRRGSSPRFDGRRWDLPSRIYSDLYVLRPGEAVSVAELQAKLERLFYQQIDGRPERPGRYRIEKDAIEIHTRPFRYPGHDFAGPAVPPDRRGQEGQDDRRRDRPALPALFLEPERLGSVFSAELEDRTVIRLADAPRSLVDAVLVTEDRDFYRHAGVSVRRLFGALFASLTGGRSAGRLDADPAARQEPLPLARAHGPAQGDRGRHGRRSSTPATPRTRSSRRT